MGKTINRFIKFSLIGASGLVVSLSFIYIFVEFAGFGKHLAWLLGTVLAILSNYFLNSIYTFVDQKAASGRQWRKRLFFYYLLTFLSALVNYIFYSVFLVLGVYYLLAACAGLAVSTTLNFYGSIRWIWQSKL